jgi:hypothetical protein
MGTKLSLFGACTSTVSGGWIWYTLELHADWSEIVGVGGLLAIAAVKASSFGGFCACVFIIGNGLGSLETAANSYITGA